MPYIHSVKIDRKTGEIIDYKIIPSDEIVNNKPLADYLLKRIEEYKKLKK